MVSNQFEVMNCNDWLQQTSLEFNLAKKKDIKFEQLVMNKSLNFKLKLKIDRAERPDF